MQCLALLVSRRCVGVAPDGSVPRGRRSDAQCYHDRGGQRCSIFDAGPGSQAQLDGWPQRIVRKEYEYIRRGTCCALAAFDVFTGKAFVKVVKRRTAEMTVAYLEEIAKANPTGDVYIVWDNLNTHKDGPTKRWTAFNARHNQRFHFVFTPIAVRLKLGHHRRLAYVPDEAARKELAALRACGRGGGP